MAGLIVQFLVKDAPIRQSAAVARQTLVGVDSVRSTPRSVHVEGVTAIAVSARGVMFAVADQLLGAFTSGFHALAGVAVALAPGKHKW